MSPAIGGAEAVHDLEQAEAQVRRIERCMDRWTEGRRMSWGQEVGEQEGLEPRGGLWVSGGSFRIPLLSLFPDCGLQ